MGHPILHRQPAQFESFLSDHLESLDPDDIAYKWDSGGSDAMPHWRFRHEGWEAVFYPIPKSPELRDEPGIRPIGLQSYEPRWLDTKTVIRDAVAKKGNRYGKLDLPYVVAVNVFAWHVDRSDIVDALLGTVQYVVPRPIRKDAELRPSRKRDGAWTSRSRPRYTRVSAALVGRHIAPWHIPNANVRLYHNPWASRPYESELTRLPQAVPNGDQYDYRDGESLSSLFGLPSGWPKTADDN